MECSVSHEAEHLNSAIVLRLHGLRNEIHPIDAFAYTHPDKNYVSESIRRDRELFGNDIIGPWTTDSGIVWIVDIRPQMMSKFGIDPTDPELPDKP